MIKQFNRLALTFSIWSIFTILSFSFFVLHPHIVSAQFISTESSSTISETSDQQEQPPSLQVYEVPESEANKSFEANCEYVPYVLENFLQNHLLFSGKSKEEHITLFDRMLERYIHILDPKKMIFSQRDVRAIEAAFLSGKLDICTATLRSYDLFARRYSQHYEKAVHSLKEANFSLPWDKEIILDSEDLSYPQTEQLAFQRFFYNYALTQMLANMAEGMSINDAADAFIKTEGENLSEVQEPLKPKASKGKIYNYWYNAIMMAGDPHSAYISEDSREEFRRMMTLSLEGGIGIGLIKKNSEAIVKQIVPGAAADRDGHIQVGDRIVAVCDAAECKDKLNQVSDLSLKGLVDKLRGKAGTKVHIWLTRKPDIKYDVILERARVVQTEEAAHLYWLPTQSNSNETRAGKVAAIQLPSFYISSKSYNNQSPVPSSDTATNKTSHSSLVESASRDVRRLLIQAQQEGAQAVVLDLSNDPGGALQEAVSLAGLFIGSGNIVRAEYRQGPNPHPPYLSWEQKFDSELLGEFVPTWNQIMRQITLIHPEPLVDNDPHVVWSGPLVVLLNRHSASASEIVAGSLQAYRRAVIVGSDRSFGKGSIQGIEPLMITERALGPGELKITEGLYFLPNGKTPQHQGITSDIVLPNTDITHNNLEKDLKYSIPPRSLDSFLSPEAYVHNGSEAWTELTPEVLLELRQLSEKRVNNSPEFQKIKEEIVQLQEQKSRITLKDLFKKLQKNKEDEVSEISDKYIERPDVQEAGQIALDLLHRRRSH